MNCAGDFSTVVPPENMNNGALINGMVRIDDLWSRELKERVDGNKDYADGIIVNGTSPLKVVICGDGERGSDVAFPKRGEGTIVGLMD